MDFSPYPRSLRSDGIVIGMLGVVQDLTEQVRARETLRVQAGAVRASEEQYHEFGQNSSEASSASSSAPINTSLPVEEQVPYSAAITHCAIVDSDGAEVDENRSRP